MLEEGGSKTVVPVAQFIVPYTLCSGLIIYTTNTVEGFNRQIRKITKTKGGFNDDTSLFKLVFLAYRDIAKKWEKSIPNWAEIITELPQKVTKKPVFPMDTGFIGFLPLFLS